MRRISRALAITALTILCTATGAEAQFTNNVFAAKFICGFLTGDVPDFDLPPALPRSYSTMGPGDYATLVTALNVGVGGSPQNLTTTIVVDGQSSVVLGTETLGVYEASESTCPVIVAALEAQLGIDLDGRLIQGYLVLEAAGDSNFNVSAAYSNTALNTSAQGGRGVGSSVNVVYIEPRLVDISGD